MKVYTKTIMVKNCCAGSDSNIKYTFYIKINNGNGLFLIYETIKSLQIIDKSYI